MSKLNTLYDILIETIDGKMTTLKPYQGQVMLIVNVASRCGFTSQYAALEALQQDYQAKGFTVLGFPCNQFLNQEPASNQEVKAFAESCFRVTFPLFAKIKVNGAERSPLYAYFAKHIQKKTIKLIPWNFTKVLIDANGNVIQRFLPTTSFNKIRKAIQPLLHTK